MLSVRREGKVPPLDKYIVSGFVEEGGLSEDEERALTAGKDRAKITKLYVEKLIPAWREKVSS